MRKSFLYILCFVVACQLIGCGGGEEQRCQLAELEERNHSGQPMLNDTLAEALVAYFDRHGSANERMRAKYLLGRTYYCLGELPRALETYFEAADCADTTASGCDFAKLSRIHAQNAKIYYDQVQPRSQLKELRLAEYYAHKGKDTLMSIECLALQANAYQMMGTIDSIIVIKDSAALLFERIGRKDRASQTIGSTITSLIKKGNIVKAREYCNKYEQESGFFDDKKNISKGHEIYYYIKGEYYLAINKIDSAELLFRKELLDARDLNNQIAGCKGLQKVFEIRRNSDSIAKYANLGYVLNDSAYSLSEMQNIQKFQASYNYNYHKILAEKNENKAERILLALVVIGAFMVILLIISYVHFLSYKRKREAEVKQYKKDLATLEKLQTELQDVCSEERLSPAEIFEKKHEEIETILRRVSNYKRRIRLPIATLEERLIQSQVVRHMKKLADSNPYQKASQNDFSALRCLINEEIPHFYTSLNTSKYTLSVIEYDVTLLLRVHFSPMEIHKLTGLSPSYVSNMRSRLLFKVFAVEGAPSDYDKRIMAIS